MRKLLLIAGAVASLAVSGTALANGPGGSTESSGNEVSCNHSNANVAGNYVYAGTNGAEACNDAGPVQGRLIATPTYVAADGDQSNNSNAQGYLRIDSSGAHCGHPGAQDSTVTPPPSNTCP